MTLLAHVAPTPLLLFYIYEWPASVVNSWPTGFTFTKRLSLERHFETNHAVGRRVNERNGFYHTHQYSLFRTFLGRLRESALRTRDPSKASLFFVPYDAGMDATTRSSDGAFARTRCPRGPEASRLLSNSTYFQRNEGRDHVMLHSINQMMLFHMEAECRRFYQLCFHCTKLGIDVYSPSTYRELKGMREMSHRWISIPFPSNYHRDTSSSSLSDSELKDRRWYHLAYIGSDRVTARRQKELRIALRQECYRSSSPFTMARPRPLRPSPTRRGEGEDARSDCLYVDMASHDSMAVGMFHFLPSDDRAYTQTPFSVVNPYSIASLCLMPGGDFPSRKGFLDAMLVGCVPVLFQESTAITQWPWHWGTTDMARSCTVLVAHTDFLRDAKGTFQWLLSLAQNSSLLESKRQCMRRVSSRMQYRLPGAAPSGEVDAVDVVLARLLHEDYNK